MTVLTQIDNAKTLFFEREHEGKDSPVRLRIHDPADPENDWRSAVFSNFELAAMCVQLQRFAVERTDWFPIYANPVVVAAFEKRLVDGEGKLTEWREKQGIRAEREAKQSKLLDALANYVEARDFGFEGNFDAVREAFEASKEG